MNVLRKITLPEIEDAKTRRKYEYNLVKALRNDEEKKGTGQYKKLVQASDEQLRDMTMICYDNGWSVDPDDKDVLFSVVFGEDEDGNEIVTLVDIVELYGATLKEAMATGLYSHIETSINGVVGSNEVHGLEDVITTNAYRIDGNIDTSSMTVVEVIEHAIEYSPSVKAKTPQEFFDNWQKMLNGDTKQTGYWYKGFPAMCKKTVLRKTIKTDRTSAYSEDYLEALRESAIQSFAAPTVSVDINTMAIEAKEVAEVTYDAIDISTVPMIESNEEIEI